MTPYAVGLQMSVRTSTLRRLMNSRFLHFSPALLLLLIMAVSLTGCSAREVVPDVPPAPVTHNSNQFPYSIDYDLNRWRMLKDEERQTVMSRADILLANSRASHFIGIVVEEARASLVEMRTRALVSLQTQGPDMQVLSQDSVEVAGVPALRVRVSITMGNQPLLYELVFLQYGELAYQFSYWTEAPQFEKRLGDFRFVVESFSPRGPARSERAQRESEWVSFPQPAWRYMIAVPRPAWGINRQPVVEGASHEFRTSSRLAFLSVIPERFIGTSYDLEEAGLQRLHRAAQGQFEVLHREDVMVEGHPGRRVEAATEVEGHRFRYLLLYVVRGQFAYQVVGWAPEKLFEEQVRQELLQIFDRFEFL